MRQSGIPGSGDICKVRLLNDMIDSKIANVLYPNMVNYDFGLKFITQEERKAVLHHISKTFEQHRKYEESSELFIPNDSKLQLVCEVFNYNWSKGEKSKPEAFVIEVNGMTLYVDNETIRRLIQKFGMLTFSKNDYRYIVIKDYPYSVERRLTEDGYIITLYR